MNEYYEESAGLLQFIKENPSSYHVTDAVCRRLEQEGFCRLDEQAPWRLEAGGDYYVTRNGSSVIAFRLPRTGPDGFQIICSHTDSPSFKIKENPELVTEKKYVRLNVEKYGGMLCAPWFDRPLSVAGRVFTETESGIRSILVNVDRDLLIIPNVAIHMNRKANEGFPYNAQVDLCPVFGDGGAAGSFMDTVAEYAKTEKEKILGMDLFLYNRQRGAFLGKNQEFIGSPRLDDLQCLYGSLEGFLAVRPEKKAAVFCGFDNEETGSVSRQGADSTFLQDTLKRIYMGLGRGLEAYMTSVAGSFLISADNAHALHPNHQEYADPVNRPEMNGGIVIKYNANQKYTTDGASAAVLRALCRRAGVPYQVYTNRSDIPGGSTLGNISSTHVSVPSADIGLAQLAMHSPYEMAGTRDVLYLKRLAKAFYQTTLCLSEEGAWRLS